MGKRFEKAAARQYRYRTFYAVWLCGPKGEREQNAVQARFATLPDAATATYEVCAGMVLFSNGWRIEFGDTIRREAAASEAEGT